MERFALVGKGHSEMVAMVRTEPRKAMGDDVKKEAAGMELMKPTQIGLHQVKHR